MMIAFARRAALLALCLSPLRLGAQSPRGGDSPVVPGIEVLLADSIHLVRGKRVGLITNHTGRDRAGRSSIDRLHETPGVRLVALFGPEHGLRGTARGGAHIAASVDSATGVPIHSLYGQTMVPTPAMLRDVDVLLYDIQDVGARAYTYVWTMALAARAAKRPFIVLDRPDPIRADVVEGGLIEPRWRTITGLFPVPIRYGLTAGELIRWLVGTGQLDAEVSVVPMRGYRRSAWYDAAGLPWTPPSPNIRTLDAALLYPGMVFFEATTLSEGRGTEAPLTMIGAPWLTDAPAIAREMNALAPPGLRFAASTRRIARGEEWGGRTIPVVIVSVVDRDRARPVAAMARLLRVVYRRHPRDFRWRGVGIEELSGSRALRQAIEGRRSLDSLLAEWERTSERFGASARRYWLYPE